ncbi:MAG TPA: hypothetical protein VN238_02335, partial [Solirubrobacteraceae bacterium]|nr:hypothetical protein [Solirubrobacteraceae bacterium]
MPLLPDPYGAISAPTRAGIDPSSLQAAEVVLLNPDGTIDVRVTTSRATRANVPLATGGPVSVGEHVVIGHLDGDPQTPVAFGPGRGPAGPQGPPGVAGPSGEP